MSCEKKNVFVFSSLDQSCVDVVDLSYDRSCVHDKTGRLRSGLFEYITCLRGERELYITFII